jgi:hypothetical protein
MNQKTKVKVVSLLSTRISEDLRRVMLVSAHTTQSYVGKGIDELSAALDASARDS